jgi:hypothetical protein
MRETVRNYSVGFFALAISAFFANFGQVVIAGIDSLLPSTCPFYVLSESLSSFMHFPCLTALLLRTDGRVSDNAA